MTADAERHRKIAMRLVAEIMGAESAGENMEPAIEKVLAECAARARAATVEECAVAVEVFLRADRYAHAANIPPMLRALPLSPPACKTVGRLVGVGNPNERTCLDCGARTVDGKEWSKP